MKQLLALLAGLGLLGGTARAEGTHPTCTVRVVHAGDPIGAKPGLEAAPRIDPRIDRLRPYLLRPPFTAWREFDLVDSKTLELQPNVASSFTLPNGKIIALTFLEHLPDEGKKKHRVRLQLEIHGQSTNAPSGDRSALKTVFVVEEGGLVLQAGQPHSHGMLVVGTSCTEPGH